MKKHLKKLRPLLLLAVLFMLTNCQEEFQDKPETQQDSKAEHTILTGADAHEMKAKLITSLEKSGSIGLSKLSSKLIDVNNDPTAATLRDVKQYIDDSEVYRIRMEPGKENYTYQINIPNASSKKFYNLVVKRRGAVEKTVLVAYNLDKKFESEYSVHRDFSKFSGYIAYETIAADDGFPCDEEPGPVPVGGGTATGPGGSGPGGGGSGSPNPGVGTGIGGPYNPGNPYLPYNQLLVDAKFQVLRISAGISVPEDDWEYVSRSPRWFKSLRHTPVTSNPCDEDEEIGILDPLNDPDKRNCEELAKFVQNAKNLASLRNLEQTSTNDKENGYSYADGKDPIVLKQDPKTDVLVQVPTGGLIYGASHDHPDPVTTNFIPMFSVTDIVMLGKIKREYFNPGQSISNNKFILTLTVNQGGNKQTFALKIENWGAFDVFLSEYANMSDKQKLSIGSNLANEYSKAKQHDTTTYLNVLFKFMGRRNIQGLSVYKADKDLVGWTKLSYDINSRTINETPCK